MTAAILSNHRRIPPFGAAGGEPGQVGLTYVDRVGGTREILAATDHVSMAAADVFVIETPGGGGFGAADHETPGLAASAFGKSAV